MAMSLRRATSKTHSPPDAPIRPFPEHSMVALLLSVELEDGRLLPPKAEGAVVGIWADGAAYEVEFAKPFHAIVTVPATKLRQAERGQI
jgi:hypothetical protein